MYYEINVTLNGKHFFATAERSITNRWDLNNKLKIFIDKFPKEEGYEISVTKWEKVGVTVNIDYNNL
jgi:hypothetical protein